MDFRWKREYLDFRDELGEFVQAWRTPELLAEHDRGEGTPGPAIQRFQEALDERGWMRMCWPVEYGGGGRDPLYRFIFIETMEYWGMPYGNLTFTSIAPTLIAFGSEAQKQEYLPGISKGELRFALGYSEPNAGTDLASLRTRAERAGDDWIIQGQKIWTSLAESSTHIWLAARTDPDGPKHQSISVFIVPIDAEGVSIRPLQTLSGMRTNETFYDAVRVPAANLVGPLNGGWNIVMYALNFERVGLAAAGDLARDFDLLVGYLREKRPELLDDPVTRDRLAVLKIDLHRQRALATRNAHAIAGGGIGIGEASMAKVHGSELRHRLANTAMDLLGRYGGLDEASGSLAPIAGEMQSLWRMSPILRFGGGTNEVQRTIIATRHLGMPR
ncbi:MAG: acyl-CoA dehydrogenase family protein [Deltaproteobacteria bacterium]|nr:acyl-CoA dehydrogenase family protein [Deltaproteobacteria bacterium]